MCYHKQENFSTKQLKDHYKAEFPDEADFQPREFVNGFEHTKSPIITRTNPEKIQLFTWGLLPDWAKDLKLMNNTLNAKFETLNEKPSFKNYVENRCIVPCSGLYDWKTKGDVKEKNLIQIKNKPIFSLAGLWNECQHPVTGESFPTFTCVTFDGFVAILDNEKAWLDDGKLIINSNEIWTSMVPPQLDLFDDM